MRTDRRLMAVGLAGLVLAGLGAAGCGQARAGPQEPRRSMSRRTRPPDSAR